MRRILKLHIFLLVLGLCASCAYGYTPSLPTWSLAIADEYLEALYENPRSDHTYPAQAEINGVEYDCRIRFRGTSTRTLSKKSWKIEFDHRDPNGAREINLNAEYRDKSLLRNHLAMELGKLIGLPAPETRHVSLMINNVYRGVFLEVEQVDHEFLKRMNAANSPLLLKCFNSGRLANVGPWENIFLSYSPKIAAPGAMDTLGIRFTQMQEASIEELEPHLNRLFNMDDAVRYFAAQFAFFNQDGFIKNFYLYQDTNDQYRLVPWDCDATFGNDWEGIWQERFTTISDVNEGKQNALFNRLLASSNYNEQFHATLHSIADVHFRTLETLASETFAAIRQDVEHDTAKCCNNEEFRNELDLIHRFLQSRSDFLQSEFNGFHPPTLVEWETSSDTFVSEKDQITITVSYLETDVEHVRLMLFDRHFELRFLEFTPDQTSKTFSCTIRPADYDAPLFYCIGARRNGEEFDYPMLPGGWYGVANNNEIGLPTIHQHELIEATLAITPLKVQSNNLRLIGLINLSDKAFSIGGNQLCIPPSGLSFRFPMATTLPPRDTLWIASDPAEASDMVPHSKLHGPFFGLLQESDHLLFASPSGKEISTFNLSFETIDEAPGAIVINELNYNSDKQHDCGDWLELYVRETTNLSGWTFRDQNPEHSFAFPDFVCPGGNYILVVANKQKFEQFFPGLPYVFENSEFAFDNNGEALSLFDSRNTLVDILHYLDRAPWPEAPNDTGQTLELQHHNLPNRNSTNWLASTSEFPLGTPGFQNSVFSNGTEQIPNAYSLRINRIFPNPSNDWFTIEFEAEGTRTVSLNLYNLLGQHIFEKQLRLHHSKENSYTIHAPAELATGIYFVKLNDKTSSEVAKIVILK